jgi:phenylpropionate dioxygenase-like ring-hydroxylating dioxygenase large terminal subunit
VVHGMAPLAARYELLVDNLLDLSHETYLHAGLIGTPEVAATPIETDVDEAAGVVKVWRHMGSAECPPFYARSTGLSSPVDRWQDIEFFAPGIYVLHSRIAPVGVPPGPDGDDSRAAHAEILYGITPSTETTTYDFWLVARDFAVGDPEVDEFLWKMNDAVVVQDVHALDVLEQRIAVDPDPFEVNVKIDRGGIHARRLIRGLIEKEAQSAST